MRFGADAHARLGQQQLEPADVLRAGRVRGALEERSEPLATAHVISLSPCRELARIHVLDHALAQRLVEPVVLANASLVEVDTSNFRKALKLSMKPFSHGLPRAM